jgi:hypothetical protein
MIDAIVTFIKTLFAETRQDEVLVRVRVDEKRDLLKLRR